jgi:type VI secretion system FHA domain protein
MRITQTMIRAQDNNALKFSLSGDEAVASLLCPGRPGYMDPLAAAKEAVADIKSHELAVMLGVRTALQALLRRFDPDALEERLTGRNRLEAMLPSARKARYWDAFRSVYREISHEAEDDFQSMFGRSFAEAYSALTRKD